MADKGGIAQLLRALLKALRLKNRAQLTDRRRHADEIQRAPDRSAREGAHAVDVQVEPVALDIVAGRRAGDDRPEPDSPLGEHAPVGLEPHAVEHGITVGVRPPALDRGDPQRGDPVGVKVRATSA